MAERSERHIEREQETLAHSHVNKPGNPNLPEPDPPEQVQRDGSAPLQQGDAVPEQVDLIGILSDEFGVPRQVARREMLMGVVMIGDEPYRDPQQGLVPVEFWIPREQVEGKTVEVRGGETNRTYRFQVQ